MCPDTGHIPALGISSEFTVRCEKWNALQSQGPFYSEGDHILGSPAPTDRALAMESVESLSAIKQE